MEDARQLVLRMEAADKRGDRLSARAIAQTILDRQVAAGRPAEAAQNSAEGDPRAAAEELLRRTEPDAFLLLVGVLGLGLMVWLVYNYVL